MRYLVLGAGLQGRAAAYDLLQASDTRMVALADAQPAALEAARARLAVPAALQTVLANAADPAAIEALARDFDVVLSCVPYALNLPLARAAVAAGCHFLDLGGSTEIVREELALDAEARAAGVAVVPDCGLGPGMISTIAVAAMEGYARVDEVRIYDCGLPQNPRPPLNYMLLFSVQGLLNEYFHPGTALRDGRRVEVDGLSEVETIDCPPPLGRCEAAHAAGGVSTLAYTYEGRIGTLFNKLIRYPGHIALMHALRDMGFLDEQPLRVAGADVSPWAMTARVLERHLDRPGERDLVFIRVIVNGEKDGRTAQTVCEMLDVFDEATGFTAMTRTTGFSAAIVAQMLARGEIAPGARPVELAVPPGPFLAEAARRGFQFRWHHI
jgi:lysine 6-dehydrogenase